MEFGDSLIQCTRAEFNVLKENDETRYTLADFVITVRTICKIFDYDSRREATQILTRMIRHQYGNTMFATILQNILYDGDCIYYHDCDECDNANSVLSIACLITDEQAYDNARICIRCP